MTQLEIYQTIAVVIGVIVFLVWIKSQARKAMQCWVEWSEVRVKIKDTEKQLQDKINERKRNVKHSSPFYHGRRTHQMDHLRHRRKNRNKEFKKVSED